MGQAYYERCRGILVELEEAESIAHDLAATPRGRLRINAPETFGACCLAPLVGRFLDDHPAVTIELLLSDRYVDLVDEGFDAVIRLGALADSTLVARALRPHRLVACAAPTYLARRGAPATPADLAEHDCLAFVYATGLPFDEWGFGRNGGTVTVTVRSRLQSNDAPCCTPRHWPGGASCCNPTASWLATSRKAASSPCCRTTPPPADRCTFSCLQAGGGG